LFKMKEMINTKSLDLDNSFQMQLADEFDQN
jgi:hypothetical protein